ncbi:MULTISPECIES: response regulator [Rheinheimera]|uniref:Response regulator n=1 Tax=Rheinheimera marina TaxID=1774958 RepID=A0ABV9JJ65_9GAMM
MKKTILVVDDSLTLREVVQDLLSHAGFDVLQAEDAPAALALMDGRKLHLILCDLYMPGQNGLSLIQQVKQLPAYKFTPVIMLTTEHSEEFRLQAYQAGIKAWVTKPFSPHQLLTAVNKLISS